jgi:hypothetical protein
VARSSDAKASASSIAVEATLPDLGSDVEAPELRAYVFDASNRVVGSADLRSGAGVVAHQGTKGPLRLMVGPRLDHLSDGDLRAELNRLDAHEETFPKLTGSDKARVVIDRDRAICWALGWCSVVGTLTGRTVSGGIPLDLPICGAEIEVYEVDPFPWIIARIPDVVLEKLRVVFRKPPPSWPPIGPWPPDGPTIPRPSPGPGPDPAPFLVRADAGPSRQLARYAEEALGHGPELGEGGTVRTFAFRDSVPIDPDGASQALANAAANPSLRAASGSIESLRAEMLKHAEIIRPLLCFLYPLAVTKRLVGTTETDRCGRFRLRMYTGCSPDRPDLYFKAYRRVGWWRFPILEPTPVSCYTHWNYACGTEIRLHTTSPFAVACPLCPPVIAGQYWVLAMAVGNTSFAQIHGTGDSLSSPTTASNLGLLDQGTDLAPFGGSLRFRFEFDDLIRSDLGVDHYLVSWRRVGTSNPWVPLTDAVYRHRMHAGPGSTPVIDPVLLGPSLLGGQQLFEIPPATPPGGGQWVTPDVVVDRTSALFRQGFVPPAEAGNYEFRLELFDAAGVRVNAGSVGIHYYVPTSTDLTTTIHTLEASTLGLVTANGALVFQLHIDNSGCIGSNEPAVLSGQTASGDCGVLDYTSPAEVLTMRFQASHPNGYANYGFAVQRGAVNVHNEGGPVGPAPGEETVAVDVGTLLGPCVTAGFAQELYVSARATDGWNRQSQFDAHPPALPFVLKPPS